MKHTTLLSIAALLFSPFAEMQAAPPSARYAGWQNSGSIWLLTTPEGADIPTGVVVKDFPVLVRLSGESFDFTKAQAHGDTIALEFDQPIVWTDALTGQFYLDGEKDKVASGAVSGNVLTLTLKAPAAATKLTYLKESAWSQDKLIRGTNGIAALTFCDAQISPK